MLLSYTSYDRTRIGLASTRSLMQQCSTKNSNNHVEYEEIHGQLGLGLGIGSVLGKNGLQ